MHYFLAEQHLLWVQKCYPGSGIIVCYSVKVNADKLSDSFIYNVIPSVKGHDEQNITL